MIDPIANLVSEADVAWASQLMGLGPDGFAPVEGDDSRLRAMMLLDTADFEACPGSGKTTLLVAKLAVLGRRWPFRHRGVCVLSHTNAARNEIGKKLGGSTAGSVLLRHPHFIGTIHSFVNEFLAIPWLRSNGNAVRSIDTQIALSKRMASLDGKTRFAMTKGHLTPVALIYDATDFSGPHRGKLDAQTPTYKAFAEAGRASSEQGYFCFDEMFVWANELLDRRPEVATDLRQRFPFVFIDEAQDNSEAQSALLNRIFCKGDDPVRRQRFGDSNQAIYAKPGQDGAATDRFPGPLVHDIPRSHRFGQDLADKVKGFGVKPQELVGAGPPKSDGRTHSLSPAIFIFDDASVTEVLPCFGDHLIKGFDELTLSSGVFAAVAAVHDLDEDGRIPHAMGHYAPFYDPEHTRKEAAPSSFVQALAKARIASDTSGGAHILVNAVASALLTGSELAGGPHARIGRRSAHKRVTAALEATLALDTYFALLDWIIGAGGALGRAEWEADMIPAATAIVRQLSGAEIMLGEVTDYLAWPGEILADDEGVDGEQRDNLFLHPSADPKIKIRLGSIHSVKGETHTATLVLDSFYYDHHLSELKPWLLGAKSGGSTTSNRGALKNEGSRMLGRLKLHYVAMTRPTHFLALAMRKDAFAEGELDSLGALGWEIVDCCHPAASG